MTYKIQKAKFR